MAAQLLRISSIATLLLYSYGCAPATSSAPDVEVQLVLEPSTPQVGPAAASVTLVDGDGEPITDAEVMLEGNMNHAGMKPSFALLAQTEPGRYSGELEFTMGGDWFILVTAKTAGGAAIERKIDVPGVKTR